MSRTFDRTNTFTILLTAAGGIVGLGLYFKKQLAES